MNLFHMKSPHPRKHRFLTIIHRRGQQSTDGFDELLRLLSDEDVTSGQLLDDVLIQIRADSVDPNIQARFSVNEQRCGDQPLSPQSIEDKIVKTQASCERNSTAAHFT